jgi:acyl-CoA synthetase (NDP forming)
LGGGLTLPPLSAATRAELASFLPVGAAMGNPVDLMPAASAEQYRRAVTVLERSGEVDALVVIRARIDRDGDAQEQAVLDATKGGLPVLACVMGGAEPAAVVGTGARRLPCYPFPETPGRVLARMWAYAAWRARPQGQVPPLTDVDVAAARAVCQRAIAERGPGWLSAAEGRRLVQALGMRVPPGGVAHSADEAAALARRIGLPVVLKVASPGVVHKTEVGGVRLDLRTEEEVRQAFDAIHGGPGGDEGALVMPMVRGSAEVLVGMTRDPRFGPLLAFGLGGIHVEVLRDVALRAAPLTDRDADDMVRSIRGHRLLEGYRGHPPADQAALCELLLRASRLAEEVPEVRELDLNPVFALPPGSGYLIADARVRVRSVDQKGD